MVDGSGICSWKQRRWLASPCTVFVRSGYGGSGGTGGMVRDQQGRKARKGNGRARVVCCESMAGEAMWGQRQRIGMTLDGQKGVMG